MEWSEIKGYPNYKISNTGEVWSKRLKRPMKPYIINSGYQSIDLHNEDGRKKFLVHRLVASAFCEGESLDMEVNHIDGNRLNNQSSNLEWVTRKENIQHNIKRGVFDVKTAQKVAWEKNKKPIVMVDPDTMEDIREFESHKEAKDFLGLPNNSSLTCALNGSRRIRYGYAWRYKE